MDKPLDEIIAANKKGKRRGGTAGRRNSGRVQILGNKPAAPGPTTRSRAGAKTTTATAPTEKIIVSNLPVDVNEAQVKELFQTTVGPLKDVTLHYDAAGRSKGLAYVIFARKGDASKAYQQYNNRLIDGSKPMKIEIVVTPAAVPLAARVAPAPAANGAAAAAGGKSRQPRRGGRGGGKTGGTKRPAKTAADLDAEMEDYTTSNAPAAAPAATA